MVFCSPRKLLTLLMLLVFAGQSVVALAVPCNMMFDVFSGQGSDSAHAAKKVHSARHGPAPAMSEMSDHRGDMAAHDCCQGGDNADMDCPMTGCISGLAAIASNVVHASLPENRIEHSSSHFVGLASPPLFRPPIPA